MPTSAQSGVIVYRVEAIDEGDVIAYPGRLSPRQQRQPSDLLVVTRIARNKSIWGKRQRPQEWERDVVFTISPHQVEGSGIEIVGRAHA